MTHLCSMNFNPTSKHGIYDGGSGRFLTAWKAEAN